jgi:lipid II:glycine glycyltransferase (peptidoglycan interpeptide bridge formation enzyme)
LVDVPEDLNAIVETLRRHCRERRLSYLEVRPLAQRNELAPEFRTSAEYYLHRLDLTPSLATLFSALHKDSTQRKIRRAEREGLRYEEGRSAELLSIFYKLLVLTRRRHRVPPQPLSWYKNITSSFGSAAKIRVAFKDQRPIASIFTISYKNTLVYKWGCSDAAFHRFGGMHFLLWKCVLESKRRGFHTFDLGRSGSGDTGLVVFKDRWGAVREQLFYSRYDASPAAKEPLAHRWAMRIGQQIFTRMPSSLQTAIGSLLYKHVG